MPTAAQGPAPMSFALQRGLYQNNGATPWYAMVPLGYPGQTMKIALDTGSNFIWTTSTLCGSGCQHYGNQQFDYATSQTFEWLDQTQQAVSFGPWGTMMVELGRDYVSMPSGAYYNTPFYLAASYSGSQFQQLDWDGGLGLPSGNAYTDPNIPHFVAGLMNTGLVDAAMPYLSFSTDPSSGTGTALIGGFDPNAFDPNTGIFMRWSPYSIASLDYIWTTALASYQVGEQTLASNVFFCLDSGSSQFKGDPTLMSQTLGLVSGSNPPDVTLTLGYSYETGQAGVITVPPSVYDVTIQAGPQQGQTLPQFAPLDGVDGLVLVGSLLMDQLYTIFEYSVLMSPDGYILSPHGMWVFNKTSGPSLIRSRSQKPAPLGRKPVIRHV